MVICEAGLHLYVLASLMSVRWVKRSSILRFEFFDKSWPRNSSLGSIEFDVKEVADFKRLAPGKVSPTNF